MTKSERGFVIDNNILKGDVVEFSNEYTSLGKFILDKLENNINFVGQMDAVTGEEETYREMRDRSVRCALWMKSHGILPGDVIAICTHNHLDTAIPCLAAMYIGVAFNPLDLSMNIKDMKHVMNITKPKLAFVSEASAEVIALAAKEINLDLKVIVFGNLKNFETFSRILAEQKRTEVDDFRCMEITNPDHIAMILCSSGTTGLPKGVALSHTSVIRQLQNFEQFDLTNKNLLIFSSLYWISGTFSIFIALSANIKRIVSPSFEEDLACRLIEKCKATWILLGSSLINRLLKSKALQIYDLSCVERIVSGGAILSRESQEALARCLPNAFISVAYGMTELGGVATAQKKKNKSGSCGVVSENVQLKVVDPETKQILGPNQNGEFWVKGPSVMTGYYGNPQATEETIDKEGWVHTGDIGFYDEDGEIFIVDRMKELIKYRGYQISPGEIESVLHKHPDVVEAAVCAVPHETDDEQPMAFIVKTPNSKVTERELMDLVASELSDSKKLRGGVRFLGRMPMTPSGKIRKKELRELINASSNGENTKL